MNRRRFTGDPAWICMGAALRAAACGLSGVVLAVQLTQYGFDAVRIGLLVSLGLGGCAVGAAIAMRWGDKWGRRRLLVGTALVLALGGLVFALATTGWMLGVAAFAGMVNGMGRDRGPGPTIDQAMLPETASAAGRTWAFATYNVASDAGHAAGALLGALPAVLRSHAGFVAADASRAVWFVYVGLGVAAGVCALRLSPAVERRGARHRVAFSPRTRRVVARFAALSALDSLGGGFLTSALVGYWFFRRFGVDEAMLGPLFAAARIANGVSHLGAAWLARRIGLVKTMVWTHLPSSLLLATVPWAPSLPIAVALFLLRESLVEMDVPTRQSYLMGIVAPEERLPAAGITNLVRGTSWAVAPVIAGALMGGASLAAPLVLGPGLKIAYDLGLYRAFRAIRPPEEGGRHAGA